jgi:hypothetical protein
MVTDLLHFGAGVPTVPVERRMWLGRVVAERAACPDRPPWAAVFAKAFALVAREFPPLRRAYCKFPRPHLYEYPASAAAITIEREYCGERAVFVEQVKDPAGRPLAEVARVIRTAAGAPVESVKSFRRALRVAALPRVARRLLWWLGLNIGRQRANYFGTFAISAFSALGADCLHPVSPWTTLLTYGPIAEDGSVDVRLVFDHRVLDGATVGRVLARLEEVLDGPVADELAALGFRPAQTKSRGSASVQ